jgi:hypothetical protein
MRGKQIIIAIDRLIVRESQLTPAQAEALRGRLEGELAGRLAREGGLVGLTSQARTSLTGPGAEPGPNPEPVGLKGREEAWLSFLGERARSRLGRRP